MIHILQVLCPKRHCLFALSYDDEEIRALAVEADARRLLASGLIDPWCGICGSRHIHCEDGRTRFRTWPRPPRTCRNSRRRSLPRGP